MKPKNISIIIRSCNEEKWIGACLDSVYRQDCHDFEVILVDNKSTDRTIKKAQKYPIHILSIDDFLPGKAINLGIRESKGDYIVCLSAHCIAVSNKWLSSLLGNFEDDTVAGVYGRQEPMAFTPDADKRDLLTVFGLDRKVQVRDSFFHNANSMIRRDVWENIPFDENITNIEDRLWAKAVLDAGYRIIYEPEASVFHYHGIHQNQNAERCTNVVRILEELEGENDGQGNYPEIRDMQVIALIPVRGEALILNGKPLLAYTVESAKNSRSISRVIVSTDSPCNAKIARDCGAEVPFMRETSLSEEHVDLEHVYQYCVHRMEDQGIMADVVVPLEITFPFRSEGFIDRLVHRLVSEGLDSVVAARPEFGSCWIRESDSLRRVDSGFIPRKFKEPVYIGMKGLGCATYPQFLRGGHLFGEKVGILEIKNPHSPVEVRDGIGLQFAEELMKRWQESAGRRQ